MKLTDEVPVTLQLKTWLAIATAVAGLVWYAASLKLDYERNMDRLDNARNWLYVTIYPEDPWSVTYRQNHPRYGN